MIEIKNMHKVYKTGSVSFTALKEVDLNIEDGEFVAVMGPSGSGKSTLMNILGLLDRPTDGSYHLDHVDTRRLDEYQLAMVRNRKIGFVFQNFNLLPRLSALRNVELPLLYAGVNSKERLKRAAEALEQVGLLSHANHRPNEMSGGQKQRIAIARAIINKPSIVLADEPTGNLDSASSYEIMTLFQELYSMGSTVVLVTHEPDIAQLARRIVRFRDGRLVSDERVDAPLNAKDLLEQWLQQGGLV